MSIKWNWGTGIAIAYSAFVLFMLGLVFLCTRQDYDLVTNDYYGQELTYQQVIDAKSNAIQLGQNISISSNASSILVSIPMQDIIKGGTIQFYRPDNAGLDFSLEIPVDGSLMIDKSKFKPGPYIVKASWQKNDVPYYLEHELKIL